MLSLVIMTSMELAVLTAMLAGLIWKRQQAQLTPQPLHAHS